MLRTRARFWLKAFHIFFISLWIGAVSCIILLTFTKGYVTNGNELWVVNKSIKLIDDIIIIPCAFGVIITGIMFSLLTNWGFFRHKWITAKYIITFITALSGSFLGSWVNRMEAISASEGMLSLQNPTYIHYVKMNKHFASLQGILLVAMIFISVFKPWSKRVGKKKSSTVIQ